MNAETYKSQIFSHKDRLYRLSLSMLRSPAEAQDAVQEVLLKCWDQRHRLGEIRQMEAWLLRITRNHCLDRLRSKHRRTEDLEQLPLQSNGDPGADQILESRETMTGIRRLLQRLPEKQRLLVQLRDIEGLSYQEIQHVLDLSESQVKTNLFRARKKLRAYLEKNVKHERS